MISQSVIDRERLQADFSSVVDDYVTLQRRGSHLVGYYTFYVEKKLSFYVKYNNNTLCCFLGIWIKFKLLSFIVKFV